MLEATKARPSCWILLTITWAFLFAAVTKGEPSLTIDAPDVVPYELTEATVNITVTASDVEVNVTADECVVEYGDGETGNCSFMKMEPVFTLVHVYQAAGCYQFSVNVTSLNAEAQQEICVLQSLEGVNITLGVVVEGNEDAGVLFESRDFIFFNNQTLVLNATLPGSTSDVNYGWDFGGVQTVTSSPSIRWTFDDPGEHRVSVNASNRASSTDAMTADFTILNPERLPCNPMHINVNRKISNASWPVPLPRRYAWVFRASPHLECNLTYDVDIQWTVYRGESGNETELSLPGTIDPDVAEMRFPNSFFDPTVHSFQVDATVKARHGHGYVIGRNTRRLWFHFEMSPLLAVLSGDPSLSVGYGSTLVLDGSESRDREKAYSESKKGLQYTWHCIKTSVIHVTSPCFDGDYLLPFNTSNIEMETVHFIPDDFTYDFTLTVGLPGRENGSASQRVIVFLNVSLTVDTPGIVQYDAATVAAANVTVIASGLELDVTADMCAVDYGDGQTGNCSISEMDPMVTLVHVYQAAGCYQFSVNVTSLKAEAQQEICVFQSLEGVGLSLGVVVEGSEDAGVLFESRDLIFFNNQTLVLNATLPGSTFEVKYGWDFGGVQTVTPSPTIRWTFDDPGEHRVSVNASNRASSTDDMTTDFTILNPHSLPCNPKYIQFNRRVFNASSPLPLPRRHALVFRGSPHLDCNLTHEVSVQWNVYLVESGNETEQSLPETVDPDVEEISFPQRAFDYGLYAFQLGATVKARYGHGYIIGRRTERLWIRIASSPLQATIQGGSARSVGYASTLVVDGSLSHDPDEPQDAGEGLHYTWHCSIVPEHMHESNITSPCFDGDYLLPFNTSNIEMETVHFIPDDFTYDFTLTVGLPGRENGSASQRVIVFLNVSLTVDTPGIVQYDAATVAAANVTVIASGLELDVTADMCAVDYGDGQTGNCSISEMDPMVTLVHVYQAAGCYQFSVNVTSLKAEAQQEICVFQSLEGVGLSLGVVVEGSEDAGVLFESRDLIFFNNQTLVLNATLPGSTFEVKYGWDFGGVQTVTPSPTIRWTFDDPGEHRVSVNASNRASSTDDMTADFTILNPHSLPCNPKYIQFNRRVFNASSPLPLPRRHALVFRGSPHLDCNLTHEVSVQWNVYLVESGNETEQSLPETVDPDVEEISFPQRAFDYGLYAFQLGATVKARYGHGYVIGRRTERLWIRIASSPLQATIQGGSARSVGYASTLVVDGSLSHDPDEPQDAGEGLHYTWHCSIVPEHMHESNIPCFDDDYRLAFNSSRIEMPANTLIPGQTYEFNLTVSLPGRTSGTTLQRIVVVAEDPPILSVSCLQNCEEKLNIGERAVLSVTSSTPSVTYEWAVLGRGDIPEQNFDWDGQTTTGKFSPYLAIVGGAFDDGDYSPRSIRVTGSQTGGPPGFAVYTFELNAPPRTGTCSLRPATGFALQTHFVIDCVDFWDEEGDLKYTVRVPPVAEGKDEARLQFLDPVLYSGSASTTPAVYLPLGDERDDYRVTIAVEVADIHGATAQYSMTAEVRPPEIASLEGDEDTSEALLNLTSGADSELSELISKGDYQAAVQIIGAVGSVLDSHHGAGEAGGHTDSGKTKAIREEIRTSTVNTIADMPVKSVVSLQQSSYALVAITQDKTEVTQETQLTAATTLVKMGAFLKEQSVDRTEGESDQTAIDAAALNLVSGLSNVLDAAVASVESLSEDHGLATNDTTDVEETDSLTNDEVKEKSKEVAKAALATLADVQDALIVNKVPGEEPTVIHSPVVTLTSQRQEQGTLGRAPIGVTEAESASGFILPDSTDIGSFLPANYTDAIDMQMVQFATDPFVWSEQGEDAINSQVVGLQLKTVDREEIKVANLQEAIQIFVPKRTVTLTNNTEVNVTRDSTIVVSFRVANPNATVSVLAVPSSGESARLDCCLRLEENNNGSSGNATWDDCYTNVTLPVEESKYQLPLEDEDRRLKQIFTWMIDGPFEEGLYQALCRMKYTAGTSDVGIPDSEILLVGVYSSQCMFWNDEDEKWDRTGCRVGPSSSPEVTQCLCNHLTFFGSSFLVMPNEIDFLADSKLFLTFLDNPVVVTTVAAILALYVVTAVWARRRDKADMLKACVIPLEDNDPFAHYRYDVTIVTGMRLGAGTTATATLTLTGTKGKSRPHLLTDRRRRVLQRGGTDSFLLTTRQSLGEVTQVRIWHDNGGENPEWYVSRITVHNLETDEWWLVLCNSWLGVDMGDGLIDRTFQTATPEELKDFGHLFSSRTVRDMQDGHLWFSIFNRPARSTFTRLQRVSCCLSLLLSVMLTSIMFYGVPTDPSEQVMDFGTFRITFSEILIGIESSIIAFPINLLIVTIFRYARPAEGTPRTHRPGEELKSGPLGSDTLPAGTESIELSFSQTSTDECGFSTDSTYYTTLESQGLGLTSSEFPSSTERIASGSPDENRTSSGKIGRYGYNAFLFSGLDQIVDDLDLMSPETFATPEQYLRAKQEARALVLTVMTIRTPSTTPTIRSDSDSLSEKPVFRCACSFLPNGLPHWFIYVGWFLVFSTTLVASYFTMLYGLKYGKKRSVEWLISLVVSLVQSIFLTQPLKVVLFAAFVAMVMKQWDLDDDGSEEIEERKVENAQAVYNKLLRKWKGSHYRPPSAAAVGTSRHRKVLERKMYALLREIVGYLLFIWLVLVVSYSQRDRHAYYLTKNTKDVFFANDEFESIGDVESFFEWADAIMISGLYAGDATPDTISFLVGGVRLRQLRVSPASCYILPSVTSFVDKCVPAYTAATEDTGHYDIFWSTPLVNGTEPRPRNPWVFQERVAGGVWGRVSSYSSGGYVAHLGPNETAARGFLDELRSSRWLDERTRALLVEWTLYNANTNLFSVVSFLLEMPATGGFVQTPSVRVVRLFRDTGNFQAFLLCIEILFSMYTVFYAVVEARKMWNEGRSYWRSGWNLLEVGIVLVCLTVIAVYIYRHVVTERLQAIHRRRTGDFIDFQGVVVVAEALEYLLGLLLVLCTVKFLRLLRLNPRTYLLTSVLRSSAMDVGAFAGYIGVVMCAFTLLFTLTFGNHLAVYSTVALSFESLFSLFLGEYDYEELYAVIGPMAPVMVVAFQAVATFLLLNVLISVLNTSMSDVRRNQEPSEDGMVGLLLLYKILSWFGIKHRDTI